LGFVESFANPFFSVAILREVEKEENVKELERSQGGDGGGEAWKYVKMH